MLQGELRRSRGSDAYCPAISFLLQVPESLARIALEAASKDSGFDALMVVGLGIYVFFWVISSAVLMLLTAGFMYFLIAALRSGETNIRLLFTGFAPALVADLAVRTIWWLAAIAATIVFVLPVVIITLVTDLKSPCSLVSSSASFRWST
jgi:hypothetical protein